jgi:hypothetical protein
MEKQKTTNNNNNKIPPVRRISENKQIKYTSDKGNVHDDSD